MCPNRRNPRVLFNELPVWTRLVKAEPKWQRNQETEPGEHIRDPADGIVVLLVLKQQQDRAHQRREHDQRQPRKTCVGHEVLERRMLDLSVQHVSTDV